jgi:ADP-dependent NAD(P)H-hydrate dehydratase
MKLQRISTLPPLPARPKDGHKGLFGRVLVVGGNEGMIGAPVMAGTAALRMGAGLVEIAVPRAILSAALSITPELIGLG